MPTATTKLKKNSGGGSGGSGTKPTYGATKTNPHHTEEDNNNNNNTKLFSVPDLLAPMQELVLSLENQSYTWRRHQLLQMKRMLDNHADDFCQALATDLGKHRLEALAGELDQVQTELDKTLEHLHEWMRVQAVPSPAVLFPAWTHTVPTPLCTMSQTDCRPAVLIIGPSNYPCSLSLQPAVGALAGGNPVVIKPSELCPTVAACLQKYCHEYFDAAAVRVVQGGIPETTALLQHQPWGLVFFTGSQTVGKIVAQHAAQTLTPVVLELGGKCPCYVDGPTCPRDMRQVANRILWAKTFNGGQTCAAVDTLIVHEAVIDKLIPHLLASLRIQFGDDPYSSELGRLVSPRHARRQVELIEEIEQYIQNRKDNDTKTRILVGGSMTCRPKEGYVAPTIVLNPPTDCRLMREEIFGPILPILTVADRTSAIDMMRNKLSGTPLCLYVFTTKHAVFEEIRKACPAGGVMRNDCLVLLGNGDIPFGGLGSSGYGAYHGKHTFDLFTHSQPIMYRPCAPGLDFGMARFHPFGGRLSIKSVLVTNMMKLPTVPALHSRFVLTSAMIIGLVAWLGVETLWIWMPFKPLIQQVGLHGAHHLSKTADWLEQNCTPQ